MARINIYQNDANLGIGGAVRYSERSATGAALSNFGGNLVGVGDVLQNERERENAKAVARGENMENLRVQSALMEHEDRVAKFAMDNAPNFLGEGSDGSGYEKAVADFAAKDAEAEIASRFAHRDPEEMKIRYARSANGVLTRAYDAEFNAGLKFQGEVSEKKIAGLATAIATNPDDYERSAKEWLEFATSTNIDRPQLQSRMATLGLAKLQRARMEAVAGRDPAKFKAATAGAMAGTPVADAPAHIQDTVNAASDHGVDPRTLLALGYIESRLDPKAGNPIGRDGKPMSSAEGMFQVLSAQDTLDELGIRADQKYDTAVVAPAIAAYVARQTDRMKANNVEVTPGKQYLTWNVGPGVAMAIFKANPNERMGDIVDRVLAKKSPEYRAKFKANNPSIYGPDMTAGQVIANADAKMADGEKAVAKYVSNEDATADEKARAYFEQIAPGGAPLLGARDLGEIMVMAKAKSAEKSREQQSLERGMAYVTGAAKGDPRDATVRKDVNEFVIKQGLAQGVVEGDVNAHAQAAQITENARFVPTPIMNAYSAALAGGDTKGKMATYVALTNLQSQNPTAYDASKMQADDRKRIEQYTALTTVSNLTPDEAIRRIDFYNSPEGKKQAEAVKATLVTSKDAEVKQLSELDLVKHFDDSYFSTPADRTGKFLAVATDAYKEQYVFNREQGMTPKDAKDQALATVARTWGSSRVAESGPGRNTQTFMPYPPETGFTAVDRGNGPSHDWIVDQAKNQAVAMVEQRYPKFTAANASTSRTVRVGAGKTAQVVTPSTVKDQITVKLVPDLQTAHDARSSQPRSYRLMVWLPDGTVDIDPQRFTPDQAQADREAAQYYHESQADTRERQAAVSRVKARRQEYQRTQQSGSSREFRAQFQNDPANQ